VPIAVALGRLRTARRVRRVLDLEDPELRRLVARPLMLACLFALLGLAAARPALHERHERTARTDVQVVVALDTSRSMLAAASRGAPERWQRARAFAHRLQQELPGAPIGLSSFTNRLLPYLFPTSDVRAYDRVLDEAYGIERPPPALTLDRWVTAFDPLSEVTKRQFFSPSVHRRVLVVLSDAETHDFDAGAVLRGLERAGTTPVVVRFWRPGERIFQPGAAGYHSTQPAELAALRDAGWPAFAETQLDPALRFVQRSVGSGPLVRVGVTEDDRQLATLFALAAFVPLLLLVAPQLVLLDRFRHNGAPPHLRGEHDERGDGVARRTGARA